MSYGSRCLVVHGHFYQPPRENPWTGTIDPQHSAYPWENWNLRVADECYIPMARSRIRNQRGEIVDLYNNYAHTNFNFGPTILSWLAEFHPDLIDHLGAAAAIDRTYAMAQGYNHMMLPLADARDRHVQILWGLREFRLRFGFYPQGMWLPECGIDRETQRALIDHGVKFVILSPHQASSARPFGDSVWRDVSMGAIDTRRAYRVFETDGGGRTHFDRKLDVVFYTPGLNLKVSFDHILNRPDELARELESCYLPDYPGAQLVSIVTDGEIYGHHEKRGEEALSRLFRDIAPRLGLRVCSAWEFVRDNPPDWEVKLWQGQDGNGSSWSCNHGMGRWSRDCGCAPSAPQGWNQSWRGPLRSAFDSVRDWARETARRELGGVVWDVDEAFMDYIAVVLDPGVPSRRAFVERHAQRRLETIEIEKLWRILEALHNAMLMYTSCGWFFDELSGLEPVQNMRYALRALELVQPYRDEELAHLFAGELAKANSNLARFDDGGEVFRQLVMPARHSGRELAAAMATCIAAGLPRDVIAWTVVESAGPKAEQCAGGARLAWGAFVCHDARMDRFIRAAWAARLDDFDNFAVAINGYEEIQGDPDRADGETPFRPAENLSWIEELKQLPADRLTERLLADGYPLDRCPDAVKAMLYRRFAADGEERIMAGAARLGEETLPFLARARHNGARAPDMAGALAENFYEQEIMNTVLDAVERMDFGDAAPERILKARLDAERLGLEPSLEPPSRLLHLAGMEMLCWLANLRDRGWLDATPAHTLDDGAAWVAPTSPASRSFSHPASGRPGRALGKGLALLKARLDTAASPPLAALTVLPLAALLSFAHRAGLPAAAPGLGIEYWNFLGKPLAERIAADPAGIMSGAAGDRIREIGRELGFADEALEKRILVAMRSSVD